MKRKLLTALPAILLVTAASLWQVSKSPSFQFFGKIIPRINTAEKVVALTFDDGPTKGVTDEILKVLDELKVKATFFVVGAELEQNLDEGRKIVAARHELGNHSYSHVRMLLVTTAFVQQEVEKTDQLIRATGYSGEINFRPPYGKKLLALPYYLSKTDRKTITWDVEPDSKPKIASDSSSIIKETLARVRPGSIILLHVMYPNRRESLKAVRGIIASLRQEGYRFATVSELLAYETLTGRYAIRGGKEGKERLKLLSQVMLPTTSQLLRTVGLSPGMKCLDVGCGGGFVTLLMADIVGPRYISKW